MIVSALGPRLRTALIDIKALAAMLGRSAMSIRRDDKQGRIPASIILGGSVRWRSAEIEAWVDLGCPGRVDWGGTARSLISLGSNP